MAATEKVTTLKIYVGNIVEGTTTSEEVRKLFEEYGTVVECDVVRNHAFVHMEDDIDGRNAIEQLQGSELHGKNISIQESKTQDPPRTPTVKLLVKNISPSIDGRGLRNMFKRFGYVIEVEINEGVGHICLEAIGDIGSAIKEMNGHVVEDMALSVEPAPSVPVLPTSNKPSLPPSPKKKSKPPNKSNGNGMGSWPNAHQRPPRPRPPGPGPGPFYQPQVYENDYANDYYEFGGPESYDYDRPPIPHPRASFHAPPERILRDPHAHQRANFPQRFPSTPGPRFPGPGPSYMGPRGPPRRLLPPTRPPPQVRMSFNRVPRPGMFNRVPIHHGIHPPAPSFNAFDVNAQFEPFEPQFYPPEEGVPVRRNPSAFEEEVYQDEEEVFYEDEPLPAPVHVPRYNMAGPSHRMNLSDSNSIPIGGGFRGGYGARNPQPQTRFQIQRPAPVNKPGRGGIVKRGGPSGRGWNKPQKFTAVTSEIAPGEKYPVPPMHNPGFRAPMKWPKEEVKRKVKKKKRPLIPAELPDYSIPVPEIPRPTIPYGAVLKPFPTPGSAGHSHDAQFGEKYQFGNAGASFSQQQGNTSYIDFTSDDYA